MISNEINSRLTAIKQRILQAEQTAGRPQNTVQLLAVSKLHEAAKIRTAWQAGQRAFGESYLQEATTKQTSLQDLDIEWHFIGRIQSNKTKIIAEHFTWVHGLSSLHHAQRLNTQRPESLPPLNVCIQVNMSGAVSKGGVTPNAVLPLLQSCLKLPKLRMRGLMTIPEPVNDLNLQRIPFANLRKLRDSINNILGLSINLDVLSMGMSDDLEAAIAEGATLVRIGTAIFGPRNYGEH